MHCLVHLLDATLMASRAPSWALATHSPAAASTAKVTKQALGLITLCGGSKTASRRLARAPIEDSENRSPHYQLIYERKIQRASRTETVRTPATPVVLAAQARTAEGPVMSSASTETMDSG